MAILTFSLLSSTGPVTLAPAMVSLVDTSVISSVACGDMVTALAAWASSASKCAWNKRGRKKEVVDSWWPEVDEESSDQAILSAGAMPIYVSQGKGRRSIKKLSTAGRILVASTRSKKTPSVSWGALTSAVERNQRNWPQRLRSLEDGSWPSRSRRRKSVSSRLRLSQASDLIRAHRF